MFISFSNMTYVKHRIPFSDNLCSVFRYFGCVKCESESVTLYRQSYQTSHLPPPALLPHTSPNTPQTILRKPFTSRVCFILYKLLNNRKYSEYISMYMFQLINWVYSILTIKFLTTFVWRIIRAICFKCIVDSIFSPSTSFSILQ